MSSLKESIDALTEALQEVELRSMPEPQERTYEGEIVRAIEGLTRAVERIEKKL